MVCKENKITAPNMHMFLLMFEENIQNRISTLDLNESRSGNTMSVIHIGNSLHYHKKVSDLRAKQKVLIIKKLSSTAGRKGKNELMLRNGRPKNTDMSFKYR